MEEVNKIMVALIFSEHSEEIFRFAVRLAENLNSRLIVASIVNVRDVEAVGKIVSLGYEVDGDHYIENVRNERQALLDQYVRSTGFPPERIKSIIRVGNPATDLMKISVEENVDMIVMGTKGHSSLEHFFVGSVAEKVFRRSPVTIVSYRGKEEAKRLKKRLVGHNQTGEK